MTEVILVSREVCPYTEAISVEDKTIITAIESKKVIKIKNNEFIIQELYILCIYRLHMFEVEKSNVNNQCIIVTIIFSKNFKLYSYYYIYNIIS